jgi:hypothetical protein
VPGDGHGLACRWYSSTRCVAGPPRYISKSETSIPRAATPLVQKSVHAITRVKACKPYEPGRRSVLISDRSTRCYPLPERPDARSLSDTEYPMTAGYLWRTTPLRPDVRPGRAGRTNLRDGAGVRLFRFRLRHSPNLAHSSADGLLFYLVHRALVRPLVWPPSED